MRILFPQHGLRYITLLMLYVIYIKWIFTTTFFFSYLIECIKTETIVMLNLVIITLFFIDYLICYINTIQVY